MAEKQLSRFVDVFWEESIVPTLTDYIRIPNKSPAFDPDWEKHGYMQDAVALLERWARSCLSAFPGASLDVVRLEGRTPLILIEIPGSAKETVLLYGHLDKQPEFTGWGEGLAPWTPVRRGEKLYGRGGADDGYAIFASLGALLALKERGLAQARCLILIEASEESGSPDLAAYVDHLAPRIGTPSLVVCLDSGCGNYDQLWLTTSLRGNGVGELSVRMLEEGVHSGDASGIVPSAFRILTQLIARIEDPATGSMGLSELNAQIPSERIEQAKQAAGVLGADVYAKFPWAKGARPVSEDLVELILNRTWRPELAITGIGGIPQPQNAGNVMLPALSAKLSLRLPPSVAGERAARMIKEVLEAAPPYGATVSFAAETFMAGWQAPPLAPWLKRAVAAASQAAFGRAPVFMGEGGSIPFMAMLGEKFPATQFVVTGVLGPGSNAHGPNEFLHIGFAKKLTEAIALIIADHAAASGAA